MTKTLRRQTPRVTGADAGMSATTEHDRLNFSHHLSLRSVVIEQAVSEEIPNSYVQGVTGS